MTGTKCLFVPGPTNVPEDVRKAIDMPMEDHRAPDLPQFTLPLFEDLKKIFKTQSGQVFLFPASGTGGWEAAITNTLNPGDKVLASRLGQFSHLWIDLCQRMELDVEVVECEWGTGVPAEEFGKRLAADTNHEIKAVLATQNETATGVQSDIGGLRATIDAANHPAMLYVDGVSSIGSVDFRMDEWGVDLAVSGSQKGFMLPAGLAIMAASQKALEASKTATMRRCYFDFKDMIATNATGYFPYTPPMSLLRGLRASVDRMLNEGLDNIFARHNYHAEGVRRAVEAWGLTLCAKETKWQSDTVSAIVVPDGHDANAVIQRAYHRYGLSLGAGLSVVAGKVFRIGHLGDLNELMLMSAIAGAEMAMRDVGIPIEAGSGVAAAEEFYRLNGADMEMAAE
ncbi:aminotransferase class V-fold PLP-dependent enzyme [Pseudohalocynthiibacter sp. F2068]|jgi:alanine-glyoxylate transaminase / serine-glyoxylate transaminase / serine-pyruvate transaminase|uniref:aminotransferase class V-fold PLP-dependent enzyme n=1 Tax=Pseudohalocynthiibacter sp. F2068 TaxID=2926418 RepID=UPI001FF19DFC|nr:aminotransferase class V-fold PLP-dependent enzyme [Pseudohalocynthiibacter sp. F2068]MCK0103954.1 aminotransferase class V-fold PLP-dependent enzyme [Pseudohalocynthiibacter sp. F2068]